MNGYFLILFASCCIYLVARLLMADYFCHKEGLISRINVKMTKGQVDG